MSSEFLTMILGYLTIGLFVAAFCSAQGWLDSCKCDCLGGEVTKPGPGSMCAGVVVWPVLGIFITAQLIGTLGLALQSALFGKR